MAMDWKSFVRDRLPRYLGGDIEYCYQGYVLRGPIKSVAFDDTTVCVETEWLAQQDPNDKHWTLVQGFPFPFLAQDCPLTELSRGRIMIKFHQAGFAVMFPVGHKGKLDPQTVQGHALCATT